MKEEFYNLCNWIISSILVHEKYLSRRKYTRKNFIVIYYISLAVKQETKSLKFEYNSNYIPFRRDRNDRLIIPKDSSSSATFPKKKKEKKKNKRKKISSYFLRNREIDFTIENISVCFSRRMISPGAFSKKNNHYHKAGRAGVVGSAGVRKNSWP